jgi:hypothetical protein
MVDNVADNLPEPQLKRDIHSTGQDLALGQKVNKGVDGRHG